MEEGLDVTSPIKVLECIVVTPEATVLETPAQFVALPLFDGELGIAPGHAPMIGRLGYGELRFVEGDRTSRYYVDGGFVQVAGNVVSIMTGRAVAADSLDAAVTGEQLEAARTKSASGDEQIDQRDRTVAQVRAQNRLANKS